jgi:D-amino-acid dehydrogenase
MAANPIPRGASIAVIGAGIIGTACAFVLAERGYVVTLFDRDEPGRTGPSFGNAGHIVGSGIFPLAEPGIGLSGIKMLMDPDGPLKVPRAYLGAITPWLWRFWRSSYGEAYDTALKALTVFNVGVVDETEALFARAGIAHMVKRDPALYLYESEASYRASRAKWSKRDAAGLKSTHIDAAEIRRLEPSLAPIFPRGVISNEWAIVTDPFEVVGGLFAAGQQRGVTYEHAKVSAIAAAGDSVSVTSNGRVENYDAILVTAGVWSKSLAAAIGDVLPVEAERGYNLTYPEPKASITRPLVLADRGVVATALKPGLRLGGWTELGGTLLPPNSQRWQKMREITDAVIPGLKDAPAKEWMGHRPSMPDSVPVLSRSAKHPAVFYAVGHGHYGLSYASKTARVMGELIAGEATDEEWAAHSIRRFS